MLVKCSRSATELLLGLVEGKPLERLLLSRDTLCSRWGSCLRINQLTRVLFNLWIRDIPSLNCFDDVAVCRHTLKCPVFRTKENLLYTVWSWEWSVDPIAPIPCQILAGASDIVSFRINNSRTSFLFQPLNSKFFGD